MLLLQSLIVEKVVIENITTSIMGVKSSWKRASMIGDAS